MQLQRIIFASAIAASTMCPTDTFAADPDPLGPLKSEQSVAYRLDSERRGTKDSRHIQTTLTFASDGSSVRVTSTSPAETATATQQTEGALNVAGDLQAIIDPYNELQTAFHGLHTSKSVMNVLVGKDEVVVPVVATISGTSDATIAFTGQVQTKIHGFKADVVVNVRANLVSGRVVTASAANSVTASLPFHTLHLEQIWRLMRLP